MILYPGWRSFFSSLFCYALFQSRKFCGTFFISAIDFCLQDSCILLRTYDGGETWDNLLADPATLASYLPAGQFPTEKSLMESIVSAELRPASRTAVYLTIRYHPYESIHVYDFEATRQTVITANR